MTLKDQLSLSWKSIKGNKLRTAITVIIMALGIFSLILIITSIKAASNSLTSSFSSMGANSFAMRYKTKGRKFGGGRNSSTTKTKKGVKEKVSNLGINISYDEARQFKKNYNFPGTKVSVGMRGPTGKIVNTAKLKTNPDTNIFGGDENYLEINGYKIAYGRNFTELDVQNGNSVCMIGGGIAERLFPDNVARAVDAVVKVDDKPYRIIAVLEDEGSSMFSNKSKVVITTYNNLRRSANASGANYVLAIMVDDLKKMEVAIGEATGTFRPIRKLKVTEEENFEIEKSDSVAESLLKNLGFLEKGTIGIAFITLIGAAIGLMNIMLVAVNERTKEIGLTKALGGTKADIRAQFIFESIMISLLGAVAGIISGILIGNIVALLLSTGFVVPWAWVIAAIVVCTVVGLAAGVYPAYKASNLDPIVALRYE